MLGSPAAEGHELRGRGASLIVLVAAALAVAGCATAAPAEPDSASPVPVAAADLGPEAPSDPDAAVSSPPVEVGAAALPFCGIDPLVLVALPVRQVTDRDLAEIEAALGFPLPGAAECGLVDESRSSGFGRVVVLELGSDPAPIGALVGRLHADRWRDLSWSGPPAFVRHGVHVAPSLQSWLDESTGLESAEATVVVSLP
jgi:hypothetical protein